MASAYATLAADGEHHSPYVVDRVEDRDGKVIFRNQPKGERAISPQVARQVNEVLTQVVQRGTGTAARVSGWDVGGKTGSTDNNTNAWFVGYTRTLATAVWMGAPEGDISMRNVNGVTVYGGTYPAQIWGSFTRKALAGTEPVDFTAPDRSGQRGSKFLALAGEKAPSAGGADVRRRRRRTTPTTPSPARRRPDGDHHPEGRRAPRRADRADDPRGHHPRHRRPHRPGPRAGAEPQPGLGTTATGVFDNLLLVQDHDSAVDRLRHRRRTLPELAELAALEARGAALDALPGRVGGRRDEVARRQRRAGGRAGRRWSTSWPRPRPSSTAARSASSGSCRRCRPRWRPSSGGRAAWRTTSSRR